ncbi:MAG: ATP-dependent RecD-like DNA helicase [Victivallales bacterium]|nr:ATP-dependent RecD-like DNA helicase [Victivallales bacterium]
MKQESQNQSDDRTARSGSALEHTVRGEVLRVLFASADGQYTVLKLLENGCKEQTIVGPLAGLMEGQEIEATGRWETHKDHGRQLRVREFRAILPSTDEGIRRYLGSGLIPGIGPKYAERIVEHFGTDTLRILSNYSERLLEVPGIGKKRVEEIRTGWREHAEQRDVLVFLQGLEIGSALCARLLNQYGQSAAEVVRRSPYRLAAEVRGVGFLSADRIAGKLGIAKDDPRRLAAGTVHVLDQLALSGHVCYPREQLLVEAAKTLDVTVEAAQEGLTRAGLAGLVVEVPSQPDPPGAFVYRQSLLAAEQGMAEAISVLLLASTPPLQVPAAALGPGYQRLNEAQRQAVAWAFQTPVSIITGGPGVGKTTVVGQIVATAQRLNLSISLAAPTGRAAKRMAETSGLAAQTLHRLLKWDAKSHGFQHDPDRPLPCKLLVVDEVSMLDISLACSLFRAIAMGTRVVLVGDRDQLPSVGPGSVLQDLIESGRIPVTQLVEIYRQSEAGRIISNAHAVNHGQLPDTSPVPRGQAADFYWIEKDGAEEVADLIVRMVSERIPHRFGFNPMEDVQVLAPMRRGSCGTLALNENLQAALNPKGAEFRHGDNRYRVGDRVMQTVNNYDKGVFNGDLGRLHDIQYAERLFHVAFDAGLVEYEWNDADQIALAYAVTVHKSQGSEFPVVILPLLTQHFVMLERNLVYTGMTRAKELLIMVGSHRALGIAVRKSQSNRRWTRLAGRLRDPGSIPSLDEPEQPDWD